MRLRIKFYCQEAWKNTIRYGTSSFSAVLIIAMAVSVFGVFVWVVSNLNFARTMLSHEIGILVFLKEGSRPEIKSLTEEIKKINGVAEVKFIPKEQALEEISQNQDIRQEIAILGFNPLPDTIEVKTKSAFAPGWLKNIADKILLFPSVDMVDYGQESFESVTQSLGIIQYFVYMVGTVITGVTLVLSIVTMRLTLYGRKNEMEILESIGATSFFIRAPILAESVFYGILGSLLGVCFIYAIYNVTKLRIEHIIFVDLPSIIGLIIGGTVLSFIGALIESYRQMRIK